MKIILILALITINLLQAKITHEFYRNGLIKSEVTYTLKEKKNCLLKTYYLNGNVKTMKLFEAKSIKECTLNKIM